MTMLPTSRLVLFFKPSLVRLNHVSANDKQKLFYDIIVAGGGMVGTTLACKLALNPFLQDKKILLLEANSPKPLKHTTNYSNRVSALNPSSKALLESVGAWKLISDIRVKAVKKMQVWETFSDAMITFSNDDTGLLQDIAYIVENDVLLWAVSECMSKSCSNVTTRNNAKIKSCSLPKSENLTSKPIITLEDGSEFSCNLLVGADGFNSFVRKTMGAQYLSWNYNQKGVVATLKLSECAENVVAWQRFLPDGPIALLPLTDDLSSLVWSTDSESARTLLQLSPGEFVDAVNEALWKQYPQNQVVTSATKYMNSALESLMLASNAVRQLPPSVSAVEDGSRAAFPLGFGHATKYVAPGVALVGDAAHRVHPLAGQGVNLGFGDIQTLAELLEDCIYNGEHIGNISSLRTYEKLRQRHNIPTMLAIEGLHRLYVNNFTPLVVLRSLGLQITHALNPVKKAIMKQAAA